MSHHLCLFEQAHNAEANTIIDQYMLNEVELQSYDLGLLFRFGKKKKTLATIKAWINYTTFAQICSLKEPVLDVESQILASWSWWISQKFK